MKSKARIAVASRSFSRHPVLRREIQERYENVTFNDQGASLSGESLIAFLRDHEKAVTALERLDKALFAALPELRVISKYGVGLDMIDLPAMEAAGVALGWTGGVNRRSVAELTLAAAVALLHKTPQACRAVQAGEWRQIMGRELSSSTVGIVGCGHIGKEVAKLLRAFGCRVLAHDIRDFPDFYAANAVTPMALDEMLPLADVLTLHLPLDDSTQNILDARRLGLMRPGACFINYARGGLADEAALKRMLMDGSLTGAALDVFRDEPPTDMDLVHLPNVLVTPHIGGSTEEAVLAMGRAAIAGLDAALPPSSHEFWPLPGGAS